jgi:hypothetical protein
MTACYDLITNINIIDNFIIIAYYKFINVILLSFNISGLVIGIYFIICNKIFLSIGYLISSVLSFILMYMINKMRIIVGIQTSIDALKIENDELKEINNELSKTVNNLKIVEKNINDDITVLKTTIGLVGDNADEMINNLKKIHEKLKIENNRHTLLIKSQVSLQLMNIFNHFDNDHNLVLDEIELTHAKQSILNILPNINWNDIVSQIKNKEIKLESLLSLL